MFGYLVIVVAACAEWERLQALDHGPVRASIVSCGRIGHSRLLADYRVYAKKPYVELYLRVHWSETEKVLKLTWSLPAEIVSREDGILGGSLHRASDGIERPLRDWTQLELADGQKVGVVCPDVFALDGNRTRVRFTLLRSPYMAYHDPSPRPSPRGVVSDQGIHEFRFRFLMNCDTSIKDLDLHAMAW